FFEWLSYYNLDALDMLNRALLEGLNNDYRRYLKDWSGVYELSPAMRALIIQHQKIALSSHHLYGSSRLGIQQYMAGHHFAEWDYRGVEPLEDTAFLTQRMPWYSFDQHELIAPEAETPYGQADASIYATQHQRGMTQYELTNHLGNVQATISDNRVANWVGTDSVSFFQPAIAA